MGTLADAACVSVRIPCVVQLAAITDDVQSGLQAVHEGRVDSVDKVQLELLKKRGLVSLTSWKTWSVARGPSFARVRKVLATDLTVDMLKGDKWRELDFKAYNFDAAGEEAKHGALHPLMKVRAAFRQIFVEMGFEEMSTNNYVESSFWNFGQQARSRRAGERAACAPHVSCSLLFPLPALGSLSIVGS